MDNNFTEKNKEQKALEAMEPDAQLSPEEWKELMSDKEALQLCGDILDTSFVLSLDKETDNKPFNLEKELASFKQKEKKNRRRIYLRLAGSIAAAVVIGLIGYVMLDTLTQTHTPAPTPVVVFKADQQPQKVILDKGDGKQVVLGTHEVNLTTEAPLSNTSKSLSKPAANKLTAQRMQPHTLTIPRGETFKITLCDGTEVWLNANSYFVYPTAFVGNERVVTLEGEAYFKVAKNDQQPFIVKTPHVETRVLGTEFNLRSYTPNETHVVLINGKVEVRSTQKGSAYTALTPGEDAHLQADGNFILSEVDLDSYIYWKDGYFYFDHENLKEIMENIGRWYNVNIQFRNPEAMHHKMHFVASRNKPLEHTLNLLNRMKKVTATIQGNTVTID